MSPMRLFVLVMAAHRNEERISVEHGVGAEAIELKRGASVAGGDVCVVCVVCR